ncbi:MAG TPA: hypothetical protein VK178_05835 [Opitutaceae bacterium]|nr:hypothetical protein [Opitutaceae bacterium]
MKTAIDRLRVSALILATTLGLILGLMLGQCSAGDHGGSRIDWPAHKSVESQPPKK